ncbi:MAG: carotenoid 1,2-hydratase [Chromatiaceae bacterium]|nr:carotenoid 1,2-hydratase [Chromatiaceae bacterium]
MQPGSRVTSDRSRLALETFLGDESAGFAKAERPWRFSFPSDYGGHPDFRSELWYITGFLEDEAGKKFGVQLVFFRFGLRSSATNRPSAWGTNQIFFARFALTDVAAGRSYAQERFSRVALDLSGMDASPVRVWVEDWSLEAAEGRNGAHFQLRAGDRDLGIELALQSVKPPVLEGEADLFESSPGGVAFHFYLISRLAASGALRLGGAAHRVRGEAWLDRAWGAVPMSQGQIALNRFALQLGDGRDLLCLQLRRRDGSGTPVPSCLLIRADGATRFFRRREIDLEPRAHRHSNLDGTSYPLRWSLELPAVGLELVINPLLDVLELDQATRAWSGAVEVSGRSGGVPIAGRGHVELSGYGGS